MPKSREPIPEEFKSIQEIQDFWDERSTADYWNDMEDVDAEISPALKSKLELKKLYRLLQFSPQQIVEIEARARHEKLDSKELIRKWVLERV